MPMKENVTIKDTKKEENPVPYTRKNYTHRKEYEVKTNKTTKSFRISYIFFFSPNKTIIIIIKLKKMYPQVYGWKIFDVYD